MRIHRIAAAICGLIFAPAAPAQNGVTLEIRFCPAAQVRTYPLETRRGVQSLLLQNAVVINRGDAPASIRSVDLELLQESQVLDARRISGAALERAVASGPALQQSGLMRAIAFQFCGNALIGDDVALAGPALQPRQAMLLTQQPFAYRGARDTLRIRVHADISGKEVEAEATLPIRSEFAKTPLRFPLRGAWFVAVGPTPHTAHRWALPEEFAFDIARLGAGDLSHRGSGTQFTDYYAYGARVVAAGDGVVAAMANDQPENRAALRTPNETDSGYAARVQELQMALLAKGATATAGNFVMIDHGNGEYSLYAHLQPGSVTVKAGEKVAAGAVIGKLGSSGNSTEPHLHFQVCDAPDPLACAGIPVQFTNLTLPYADAPRPLQSGDVVVAR